MLVVTHLPQIAAHADRHFTVEKRSAEGATSTDVRLLDDVGRVGELSRMLAGMEGSGLAQAHAEAPRCGHRGQERQRPGPGRADPQRGQERR